MATLGIAICVIVLIVSVVKPLLLDSIVLQIVASSTPPGGPAPLYHHGDDHTSKEKSEFAKWAHPPRNQKETWGGVDKALPDCLQDSGGMGPT